MKVLHKNLIKLNLRCNTSEDVIKELGSLMKKEGCVKESYVEAVLKREKNHPTGLPSKGISVAIPHTDSSHVEKSAISIGILESPVKFSMMGNENIKLNVEIVFMLAIDDPKAQIKLLQRLMSIFQDEKLLLDLKKSNTEEDVINKLIFLEQ